VLWHPGVPRILINWLLLTNKSQITPKVSDFLYIYFKHTVQFLKLQLWNNGIFFITEKSCLSLVERRKVFQQLYYTILGCHQRKKFENHCYRYWLTFQRSLLLLSNVDLFLPDYIAWHPRRQLSSCMWYFVCGHCSRSGNPSVSVFHILIIYLRKQQSVWNGAHKC
jgi:hypothetical protein